MKIDFSQPLINVRTGQAVPLPSSSESEPEQVTLSWVACEALERMNESEKNLSGEKKYERHVLIERIVKEKVPDLKTSEIALIKECIGKVFWVGLVRPAWDMLEGK